MRLVYLLDLITYMQMFMFGHRHVRPDIVMSGLSELICGFLFGILLAKAAETPF